MERNNNLHLSGFHAPSNSYLDDVYSHYFQPSPQLRPERNSQFVAVDKPKNDSKPVSKHEPLTTTIPPLQQKEFNEESNQSRARCAEYRDNGPIITRPSRSLLSLNIPKSSRRYFWDPKVNEWRVLDFENSWDLSDEQEIEISEARPATLPRKRAAWQKHSRTESEPLLVNLSTPKTRFVFSELLRDTKNIHPTLEFALRYSEPSPFASTFNTATTVSNEGSQLQRQILVQVLGTMNMTYSEDIALNRTGSFACISIADKEFMTCPIEDPQPRWNAQFQFESVRDTDPFEIYVWNDMGPHGHSLQGSFVATVRRILLMQTLNELLTLTLDHWPREMEIMESSRSGSVIIRVRDVTEYAWNEKVLPFTPIEDLSPPVLHSGLDIPWDTNRTDKDIFKGTRQVLNNSTSTESTGEITEKTKHLTDITGRILSLEKGRYPWIPAGDITITNGPVCGGRYCDVYVGELKRPGGLVRVAMKQLRVFINASDSMRKLFCREVGFWNELRHPNVLPFWGCWELDEYRLFMISPWAENGNSLSYVKNNPTADRSKILRQTAEALVYIHSGIDGPAIAHGDLKADNVLISGSGNALLSDFGLTRYVQKLVEVSGTPSGLSPHGHLRFSAPELLLPKSGTDPRPTPESDVFAFGCFIIQLYTEELPYREIKTDPHLFIEVVKGRVPARPTGLPEDRGFDDYMWSVASKCWEFEPTNRPSMRRIADKLKLKPLSVPIYS